MLRKTLTILSLIGLLLSVGLWGVSYGNVSYVSEHGCFVLMRGALYWSTEEFELLSNFFLHGGANEVFSPWSRPDEAMIIKLEGGRLDGQESEIIPGKWIFLGYSNLETSFRVSYQSFPASPSSKMIVRFLVVPFWIPFVLFCLVFGISYVPLLRRRKRKKLGLCVNCGYDLRASKDRCPECGEGIEREHHSD